MRPVRVGLAQINTTVGDLEGNTRKILAHLQKARQLSVDLLAFPELTITGYPPEDLLLKPSFIGANLKALEQIARSTKDVTAIVGFAERNRDIYNAAAVICGGKIVGVYRKIYLPNYGVFDEHRYFQPGTEAPVFQSNGIVIGVNICEDIWYPDGPTKLQALWGDAQLIVNISASPYHLGKGKEREKMLATRAYDNAAIVAFCNLVGGQDELVFDGQSAIFDETGELIARGKAFEEDFIVADLDLERVFNCRLHGPRRRKEKFFKAGTVKKLTLPKLIQTQKKPALETRLPRELDRLEEIYTALVLGTRDYVRKNGFRKVLIGLSGGIDSSLVACIAVDALGKENVMGVFMPSRFSAQESRIDAEKLACNLNIKLLQIDIDDTYAGFLKMLRSVFKGTKPNIAEENLQARIRGNILMALSNKFNYLVLTTGNKSELSLGYATLYGDMAGGFAVIKDVLKTLVYELARFRNSQKDVIPQRVFERPPTAELRPDQRDEEDLPAPYKILDPILQAYVEEDRSLKEIVAMGFDEKIVRRVIGLVDKNEYKRRQAPVGIKITPRAFGKDRRLPITNRFKEA